MSRRNDSTNNNKNTIERLSKALQQLRLAESNLRQVMSEINQEEVVTEDQNPTTQTYSETVH